MPSPEEQETLQRIMKSAESLNTGSPVRQPFDEWRDLIGIAGKGVRNLMTHPGINSLPSPDQNECRANIMLAYRHLEDARMRLGKAIQAIEGGVSCYDKPKTTSTTQ